MIYRYDEDLVKPSQPIDSTRLWVSDQQWLAILERIQRGASAPMDIESYSCRREHPRVQYDCRCLLRMNAQAGTYIVRTRDISAGGLCFVHGQPLRPSTRCTIAIQSDLGPGRIVSAVVAWCKEVDLFDPDVEAYEIGIKFDALIDFTALFGDACPLKLT